MARRVRPLAEDERSDARESALLLLYEAESKSVAPTDVLEAQVLAADALTTELVNGIEHNGPAIDDLISGHAKGWTLQRMPTIDRNILRIGTFELMARPDVPVAVVIDEAVELAKRFSTDDSGRFVNGVLSAIASSCAPTDDSPAARALNTARRFWRRAIVDRLDDPAWRVQAALVVAVLGLVVFVVRVLYAEWPSHFAIFYPDSFSFKNAARLTPLSPSFYAAERPIAYPTLLFLLGRSTLLTVVIQTILYGLAYVFAGVAACRVLRSNEARVLCIFGIITIAIEPRFALWNTHILSESLGQTLAVVSVVSWWLFANQPTVKQLRWAGVATIGWVTVRDSNVPPWVAVGVPALLIASVAWRSAEPALRRSMRNWALITLVVCLGAAAGQAINGRNRYATMNNIGLRVLEDEALTEWFVDWGLPLDDALRDRTGLSSFDNGWDVLTSPDLQEYRDWADDRGQALMLISYLRFAPHWIDSLYDDLPRLLSYRQQDYDVFHVADRLPDPPPAQLGGPTTRMGLLVWTLLCLAGLALTAWRGRARVAVVLGLLLASTFVDLYLAYVGDSVEVLRHMVGPLARMALVMVLCVGQGFDALIDLIRSRLIRSGTERPDPVAS